MFNSDLLETNYEYRSHDNLCNCSSFISFSSAPNLFELDFAILSYRLIRNLQHSKCLIQTSWKPITNIDPMTTFVIVAVTVIITITITINLLLLTLRK